MILQPKKLINVPFHKLEQLPEQDGIYLITDAANRVWYIGQSENIKQRVCNHELYDDFVKNNCSQVCVFLWQDSEDLDFWEEQNINYYQSPLNRLIVEKPETNLGYDRSEYFNRYADIKYQMGCLQSELEQLKPNIVTMLEEFEDCKLKTDVLTAYIQKRHRWEYSNDVLYLEAKLNTLKNQEQINGIAKIVSHLIYPVVRVKKQNYEQQMIALGQF